jgi:hypothetical protein
MQRSSKQATSPIAQMCASEVLQSEPMTTPPALAEGEAGIAGELVARRDPDGEDDDVGRHDAVVGELDTGHDAVGIGANGPRTLREVELDALGFDDAAERLSSTLVELRAHEPAAGVHDRGIRPTSLEAASGLEAEKAAAGDEHARCAAERDAEPFDLRDEPVDIVERAVDANVLGAVDRRHGCARPGREHELVPVEHGAARGRHGAGFAIDGDGRVAEPEAHLLRVPRGHREREILLRIEPSTEGHTVVWRVHLFAKHHDVEGASRVAGGERLAQPVCGRTRSDDDDATRSRVVGHGGRLLVSSHGPSLGTRDYWAVAPV